ncbi:MAG: hypothetical protein R3B07_16860 [Polyangiaceae bacterium]
MSKPRILLLAEPDAFAQELWRKLQPHAELQLVASVERALTAVVHAPTRLVLVGAGDQTFLHSNQLMRALGKQRRPLVILLRHSWEPELVAAHMKLKLRADGYLATGFAPGERIHDSGVDALVAQLVRYLS